MSKFPQQHPLNYLIHDLCLIFIEAMGHNTPYFCGLQRYDTKLHHLKQEKGNLKIAFLSPGESKHLPAALSVASEIFTGRIIKMLMVFFSIKVDHKFCDPRNSMACGF